MSRFIDFWRSGWGRRDESRLYTVSGRRYTSDYESPRVGGSGSGFQHFLGGLWSAFDANESAEYFMADCRRFWPAPWLLRYPAGRESDPGSPRRKGLSLSAFFYNGAVLFPEP